MGPFSYQPFRPSWHRKPTFSFGWRLFVLCIVAWAAGAGLTVLAMMAIEAVAG